MYAIGEVVAGSGGRARGVRGPRDGANNEPHSRFQDQKLSGSTIAPVNIPYVTNTDRKRFEIKLTESITSNMVLGYDAVVGRSRL